MKIAIIFTCYNRAIKTEKCINQLINQLTNYDINLKFYICDDGSKDDTVERLKRIEMNSKIIMGTGSLFWCKGMHLAMKAAYDDGFDYYIMINDDVDFEINAINILLDSYRKSNDICGIVGSVRNECGNISYGGRKFKSKLLIGKTELIEPNGELQECDVANWNCFMIPDQILKDVGLIDNFYEHGCGDFDYSLMMRRKGYKINVATSYVGTCNNNPIKNTSQDRTLPKIQRIKRLFSIKESPLKSNIYFYKKNYGFLGILYMVRVYGINIVNILKA